MKGGQRLTKESLFLHDGTLSEEAANAAPLLRGAMSETDAGSKATSAGNSLGVGGRSTDRDRWNKQLHWGKDYDKTLIFIRDCLYGRFKPGDPSAKCVPNLTTRGGSPLGEIRDCAMRAAPELLDTLHNPGVLLPLDD